MEVIDYKGRASRYDFTTTAILAYFLGFLGVHRFYTGNIGTGILMLITFGGFGIWALIDMIMILAQSYKDGDGNVVWPNKENYEDQRRN